MLMPKTRRDPFKTNPDGTVSPAEVIDLIPPAEDSEKTRRAEEKEQRRKERRAKYDKEHPVAAYYIPPALKEEGELVRATIKKLARQKYTTAASVASALLEYALVLVRDGRINVTSTPSSRQRKQSVIVEVLEEGWGITPKQNADEKQEGKAGEYIWLAYRFSENAKKQISGLAQDDLLPGEIVLRLLQVGLDALEKGKIRLRGRPIETRQEVSAEMNRTW